MDNWADIKKNLMAWKSLLIEKRGARDQLLKSHKLECEKLIGLQEQQRLSHLSHLFLLSEIVDRREQAIESIEKMATFALRSVYGDGYRLKFNTFEEKRKEGIPNFKMEIKIASPIEKEELLTGLIGERGGGVVEIVAFALRIAALSWLHYDGPLILDEAYKSMSNDHKIWDVANFLKEVSEYTNRQIIFATHKAEVFGTVANKIIEIENCDGVAQYKNIDKGQFEE